MKKLYLDINGVLVLGGSQPANGVEEFLKFITDNFDCYWLSTYAKNNNGEFAINYLREILPNEAVEYAKKIKPNRWELDKSEAIDFESDFYWLDDNPSDQALDFLAEKGLADRLIQMKLHENSSQLLQVKDFLTAEFGDKKESFDSEGDRDDASGEASALNGLVDNRYNGRRDLDL